MTSEPGNEEGEKGGGKKKGTRRPGGGKKGGGRRKGGGRAGAACTAFNDARFGNHFRLAVAGPQGRKKKADKDTIIQRYRDIFFKKKKKEKRRKNLREKGVRGRVDSVIADMRREEKKEASKKPTALSSFSINSPLPQTKKEKKKKRKKKKSYNTRGEKGGGGKKSAR